MSYIILKGVNMEFNIEVLKTRCKPICVHGDELIVYSKGSLYFYHENHSMTPICKLPLGTLKTYIRKRSMFSGNINTERNSNMTLTSEPPMGIILSFMFKFRIFERLFEMMPNTGVIDSNGKLWIAHGGDILGVDLTLNKIFSRYKFVNGGPHNKIAIINNLSNFDNGIVYGEYFPNSDRREVSVYFKSDNSSTWEKIYSFPEGTIRHIHNIVPDYKRKRIYILTGDENKEPGIWVAENNFKTVRPLLVGKQAYRACVLFINEDYLIFPTDTPLEQNNLTYVKYISEIPVIEKQIELPGSCIYGDNTGEKLIITTTVESDSNILYSKGRLHYKLSYKLGDGIKDRYSHLFIGNLNDGIIEEVCKFKKDIFPPALFGFGTMIVVADTNHQCAYVYPIKVKKYGGCLLKVNL
ncbi:MAG: hypothetical protein PHD33_04875 [Atribacterota bacterium]|nr:hypothetical protein [Atribacterota bacterium]